MNQTGELAGYSLGSRHEAQATPGCTGREVFFGGGEPFMPIGCGKYRDCHLAVGGGKSAHVVTTWSKKRSHQGQKSCQVASLL